MTLSPSSRIFFLTATNAATTVLVQNSNLCVLNVSLEVATETLRWKQALQKLHLMQRHVGVGGPQAGSLTVLIADFQALDHKPANENPHQTQVSARQHFDPAEIASGFWLHLRWSWGQAWLQMFRDWRKATCARCRGPSVPKKCAAMAPRGL